MPLRYPPRICPHKRTTHAPTPSPPDQNLFTLLPPRRELATGCVRVGSRLITPHLSPPVVPHTQHTDEWRGGPATGTFKRVPTKYHKPVVPNRKSRPRIDSVLCPPSKQPKDNHSKSGSYTPLRNCKLIIKTNPYGKNDCRISAGDPAQ